MKTPILWLLEHLSKIVDESSNLAHRSMHVKFQLIWTFRLVRAMGVVEIESSSYNWRKPVLPFPFLAS